jgi:glycyl-tRNA synthetase
LVGEFVPMLGLSEDEAVFARRAAHLAKADLVTRMVVEMTSLQGVMGREYALRAGENPAVAEAIGEQYQPIPRTKPGLTLALADRLDSLTGLFAAGLVPTGTRDPFGLRRAAIGIVQTLMEHSIDLDLCTAVQKASSLQPVEVNPKVQTQVLEFVTARLAVVLKDAGFRYDVVDAILAEQSNRPSAASQAVRQLAAWVARPDWSTILPGYARCVRITRDQKQRYAVDPKAFIETAETALFSALEGAEKCRRLSGSVDDFLTAFVPMLPAVNEFFEKVLVMAEDKPLQQNRLGLLQRIATLADGVADMSKLEGF